MQAHTQNNRLHGAHTSCSCSYLPASRVHTYGGRRLVNRNNTVTRAQAGEGGTLDEQEDGLSAEFETAARVADPERFSRVAAHLDLLWRVSEVKISKGSYHVSVKILILN